MTRLQVADGGGDHEMWRVDANILKKFTGHPTDIIVRVAVLREEKSSSPQRSNNLPNRAKRVGLSKILCNYVNNAKQTSDLTHGM